MSYCTYTRRDVLECANLLIKSRKITKTQLRYAKLYIHGHTMTEVADEYGITRESVSDVIGAVINNGRKLLRTQYAT